MRRTACPGLLMLVVLRLATAQVDDAGFEGPQRPGLAPQAPWTTLSGPALVAPGPGQLGRFFDAGFPTEGTAWLDLGNAGIGPAQGAGPCDPSQGVPVPGTATVVRQTFVADASGQIGFDWTWITSESFPPSVNDFATVDVVDPATGAPVLNLLYVDNGLGSLPLNAPGALPNGAGGVLYANATSVTGTTEIAPAGPKRATVSAPMLVPGATYELCLVCGNGTDALFPSRLYLDAFTPALPEATPTNQRNGPDASLRFDGLSCLPVGVVPEQRIQAAGASFSITVGSERNGRQPYALFATLGLGTIAGPGLAVPPGRVDLDLAALPGAPPGTLVALIDGIAATTFPDQLLGDTGAPGRRTFSLAMPPAGTGTLASFQALCLAPAAAAGSVLTGATRLDFRAQAPLPPGALGGLPLTLGNDAVVAISFPPGFAFPFYGASYTQVMLASNGILGFGGSGQISGFASSATFLAGEPSIAPLWSDLDPGAGGSVAWSAPGAAALLSWSGVPDAFGGGPNDAAVRLEAGGRIELRLGGVSVVNALVGISPGAGSPVGPATGTSRDLSALLPGTLSGAPAEALFEHFLGAPCDLPACLPQGPTSPIVFQPRPGAGIPGAQGYDAF